MLDSQYGMLDCGSGIRDTRYQMLDVTDFLGLINCIAAIVAAVVCPPSGVAPLRESDLELGASQSGETPFLG
jgi:hypothetical protein